MIQEQDIVKIKSIIESLLVVSGEPLSIDEIKSSLDQEWDISTQEITDLLEALKAEYASGNHGFQIMEIAGKLQFCTHPQNAEWVKRLLQVRNSEGLSKPALETLAIIAYRQPITKVEIEGIRGVNADGVLKKLTDKGLIRTRGRKEVLGHPFLYGTTERFLEYFGLKSLNDLPQKEELKVIPSNTKEETREPTEVTTENRPS